MKEKTRRQFMGVIVILLAVCAAFCFSISLDLLNNEPNEVACKYAPDATPQSAALYDFWKVSEIFYAIYGIALFMAACYGAMYLEELSKLHPLPE